MVVDWPFTIYTDSSQAHSFQHNTCPNSKIRGCFDLRDKCVQELRDKGVVKSVKIPRDLNVADLLTHDTWHWSNLKTIHLKAHKSLS